MIRVRKIGPRTGRPYNHFSETDTINGTIKRTVTLLLSLLFAFGSLSLPVGAAESAEPAAADRGGYLVIGDSIARGCGADGAVAVQAYKLRYTKTNGYTAVRIYGTNDIMETAEKNRFVCKFFKMIFEKIDGFFRKIFARSA